MTVGDIGCRYFASESPTRVPYQVAVLSGRWKLVQQLKRRQTSVTVENLIFDVWADPIEEYDLAEAQPERVADLAKRVYRLYTEEGLQLRHKTPKRKVSAKLREDRCPAAAPNEVWAMDFMSDQLFDGRRIRILTIGDAFSRLSPAIDVRPRYRGSDVVETLERVTRDYGRPQTIRVDNGPEFISRDLDLWAWMNGVVLDFSRPGKPVDNAFIESFNGTVRRECLSQHWFTGLEDAQQTLDAWRKHYNNHRPHRSLANRSPAKYRGGGHCVPDRNRLGNSLL